MRQTALDRAHAIMDKTPEDGSARLGFYHCLADTQIFLLLSQEPGQESDDQVTPRSFTLEDATYALAFDDEERLARFAGAPARYAVLPGRMLAAMLAARGAGLALNLDVAPSSILLPPDALRWLAETLAQTQTQGGAEAAARRVEAIRAPAALPQALLAALDAKLARAGGLASHACLAEASYRGGGVGHVLWFIGAAPGAEAVLTRAVSEVLSFSGIEAGNAGGALDVGFAEAGSALAGRLERVGLRFDLPQVKAPLPRAAPGSDPDKPPKLR